MLLRLIALTCAIGGGAWAQGDAVPNCSDLAGDAAGMKTCALIDELLVIAFVYAPVPDGAILQIAQSTAEGGDRRDSEQILVKGVRQAPNLYDLNGDGEDELFVPISFNDPETVFDLWQRGGDGFFAPVDTVLTVIPEQFVPEGDLIRHVGLPSGDVSVESAYLLDDAGLTLAYVVQMDEGEGRCTMVTGNTVWNEAIILADCEARLGEVELEDSQ